MPGDRPSTGREALSVEPVLGLLTMPTIATALELAGGAVESAGQSFAAALEAASARHNPLPTIELAVAEPESAPTGELIESALDGIRSILGAVGL
jgi:hypothetical protein